MVGNDSGPQNEQDDARSEDHFTDHGSEPEEGQQRSSERVFLSERAGRRVYRQMEDTERSLGTKLDTCHPYRPHAKSVSTPNRSTNRAFSTRS